MEERLIDGLDLTNTIFSTMDNGYTPTRLVNDLYYQGKLVEHITMSDLANYKYRQDFFEYLGNLEDEDNSDSGKYHLHSLFFAMLLMMRIEQLKDKQAFYIFVAAFEEYAIFHEFLGSSQKNLVAFYTETHLLKLFQNDIFFFLAESFACQGFKFFKYLIHQFRNSFVSKKFFTAQDIKINLKQGQLFLDPNRNWLIKNNLKLKLKSISVEKATFLPPYVHSDWKESWEFFNKVWNEGKAEEEKTRMEWYDWQDLRQKNSTEYNLRWKDRTIDFYDVSSHFIDDVLRECNGDKDYIEMYNNFIFDPLLKKNIIQNYHVNSEDGYTNLRSEPSSESAILATVLNDEYLYFKGEEEDWANWVRVFHPKSKSSGFIHKSQFKKILPN